MSSACTPILVGVASPVFEILLISVLLVHGQCTCIARYLLCLMVV